MEQVPKEVPTGLPYSGESMGNPRKRPGDGTWPHGLPAGVGDLKGEGGDMLQTCIQAMLMLA